jgi:hypothetical protein
MPFWQNEPHCIFTSIVFRDTCDGDNVALQVSMTLKPSSEALASPPSASRLQSRTVPSLSRRKQQHVAARCRMPVQKSEDENDPFHILHLDDCPVFEVAIILVMRERSQHNTRLWHLLGELHPNYGVRLSRPNGRESHYHDPS